MVSTSLKIKVEDITELCFDFQQNDTLLSTTVPLQNILGICKEYAAYVTRGPFFKVLTSV